MKSPASSHREQPWLSSVYGSPAAIGGSNRFEHKRENVENVLAHPVLTKQRNGGSEVQGAAEVVVVGQRRQNSGVDVAGSTQGANCNFESTGALEMSHRGCMREESGGNSPELGTEAGAASAVRVAGGEDGDAHHALDRLVLGQKGYGREERGTHRGCTATTTKSPEPGKMAELWAFCAWGVFSWTWNAMWGVCCCFWCFGLGYKEEWSGGVREREVAGAFIVFLEHPLGMGDGGCCEGRVGGCHVCPRGLSQRGLPAKDLWRGFKVDFVQQEIWARYSLGQG
uniref:Uncharacterized protein n=1 Tax=Oryza barthii TaxID=65489 RepID=A0A0D3GH43_9ORYZ